MNIHFCTYEQSHALKKLGFTEKCLYHYNTCNEFTSNSCVVSMDDDCVCTDQLYDSLNSDTLSDIVCDAPFLTQAQTWLRNTKGYSIEPVSVYQYGYNLYISNLYTGTREKTSDMIYASYESALSEGISVCIKLLNEKS